MTPNEQIEALKTRCKDLEQTNLHLRNSLEANRKTEFTLNPIINPESGQVELYSVVALISDNNVMPLIRKGIVNSETSEITWIPLKESAESV